MVVPSSPLSPDSDLVTVEEFYCLVPDGQKADLIDGVIYLASPDTRRSDRLGGFIKFLMQGYAAVQGLGEVYGSRFAFELSQFRAPEPDAAFVRTERLHLVNERRMVGYCTQASTSLAWVLVLTWGKMWVMMPRSSMI